MTYSPLPAQYEKEHRLQFEAKAPSWTFVVISGSVGGSLLFVGGDDENYTTHEMELVVGPWWRDVQDVVPFVTVNGFDESNADEDDEMGWSIEQLTWDTVGGTQGPNIDEERIRLKFKILLKGEEAHVTRIGYYLTAGGRALGAGGIDSP